MIRFANNPNLARFSSSHFFLCLKIVGTKVRLWISRKKKWPER